ncbi:hypothetical protein LCGC14_1702140 [marine sediment metagenome]|uniref:N-acetyltransferase domain-containing protein n=1 Tax=marine sediment metagenome TaxID=412755 RepID=A0A0F9KHN6_9ZZZZ
MSTNSLTKKFIFTIKCIICIAGGGVFGYQYHNIGIASKIVKQIIEDAKQRGYYWLNDKKSESLILIMDNKQELKKWDLLKSRGVG